MKKYLVGLFTIVLGIGINTFGTRSHPKADDKNLTSYYWYITTYNPDFPDGAIINSSDLQFSGVAETQPYADANDGCSGSIKHCLRGFSSMLSSFPSTATPASTTTKN